MVAVPSFPPATAFFPPRPSLRTMRDAVQACRACDLYLHATQGVFGEGARGAALVLIGEQPGDEEDKEGRPFVGPAGRMLDRALEEAKIPRQETYPLAKWVVATFHPSAILRMPDAESRDAAFAALVADLRAARAQSKR
ncbi:MAG TPA: uracil-DNA glycosylase family protein [Candidatus Polarisedimenticolaceae bacterium]|nr:uracil-DNA glycosylase family protein [Candidatus Polarisedimenticolaceae bacterium]